MVFQQTFGTTSCTEEGRSLAIRNDTSFYLSANRICGTGPRVTDLYVFQNTGDTVQKISNPQYNGNLTRSGNKTYAFFGDESFAANNDSLHLFQVVVDSGIRWQNSHFFGICNNSTTGHIATRSGGLLSLGIYSFLSCSTPAFNSFYQFTDASGQIQWTHHVKGPQNDQLHVARQTPKGNFVLGGWTNSRGNGLADFLLVKTDNSGDTLFTKTYGDALTNKCFGLEVTADSGYLLLGYDDSVRLLKTNSQGKQLWSATLGEACGGRTYTIRKSLDGGYAALTLENIAGNCRSVLYKLDDKGEIFWRKVFPKGRLTAFQELEDSTFVLTGYQFNDSTFESDLLVIGFDSTKFSLPTTNKGIREERRHSALSALQIYPNPASGSVIISIEPYKPEAVHSASIYTLNGEKVQTLSWPEGSAEIQLERSDLHHQLYLIEVKMKTGRSITGKLLFK